VVNIHAGFIIFLSLWAPTSLGTLKFQPLEIYLPAFLILILIFLISRRWKPSVTFMDLVIMESVIAGLTLASVNTRLPLQSNENFPPLEMIFIANAIILNLVILTGIRKNLASAILHWIVMLWSSGILYSQPLDKFPQAAIFPLLAAIQACVSLDMHGNGFGYRSMMRDSIFWPIPVLILLAIIQYCRTWNNHSSAFYNDLALIITCILTILITDRIIRLHGFLIFRILVYFLSWNATVLFLLALWRYLWLFQNHSLGTLLSFKLWISLIHPNALGAYLAGMIPLQATGRVLPRYFRLGIICISLAMIMATLSRGSWISCASGMILFYLISRKSARKKSSNYFQKRWLLITGALFCVVFVLLMTQIAYRIFAIDPLMDRLILWNLSFHGISDHPFFGVGMSNHDFLSRYIHDPFELDRSFLKDWYHWDRLGRHFHSLYIEILWAAGISGLIAFMGVVVPIITRSIKSFHNLPFWNLSCMTGMVIMMMGGIADCVFYYTANAVLLSVFIGIVSGNLHVSSVSKDNRKKIFLSQWRTAILVTFLIVFEIVSIFFPFMGCHWAVKGESKYDSDPAGSLASFSKSVMYMPGASEVFLRRVQLRSEMGDLPAVKNDLDYLNQQYPEIGIVNVLKGWSIFPEPGAIPFFQRAVSLDPAALSDQEHFSDLALALFLTGHHIQGIQWLKTAFLIDPNLPAILTTAFTRVSGGVIVKPANFRKYLHDRFEYQYFEEFSFRPVVIPIDEILAEIEKDLDIEIDTAQVLEKKRNVIKMRYNKGDLTDSIRLLNRWNLQVQQVKVDREQVQTYEPGSPEYAKLQALNALKNKDYETAEMKLDEAFQGGVKDAEIFFGFGQLYIAKSEWEQALEALGKAVNLQPENPEILANLGYVLIQSKKHYQAEHVLRKALKNNPYSLKALFYLGVIQLEKNKFNEAYQLFSKAYDLAPDDPYVVFNRAFCLRNIPGKEQEFQIVLAELEKKFPIDQLPREIADSIHEWRKVTD
jgi:tetratricopeptide (TPR) repeat protein/O-antigen ligase